MKIKDIKAGMKFLTPLGDTWMMMYWAHSAPYKRGIIVIQPTNKPNHLSLAYGVYLKIKLKLQSPAGLQVGDVTSIAAQNFIDNRYTLIPDTVYTTIHTNRHGSDVHVYSSFAGALKGKAAAAREGWEDRGDQGVTDDPNDLSDEQVIDAYFSDEQDEQFEIEAAPVLTSPAIVDWTTAALHAGDQATEVVH